MKTVDDMQKQMGNINRVGHAWSDLAAAAYDSNVQPILKVIF